MSRFISLSSCHSISPKSAPAVPSGSWSRLPEHLGSDRCRIHGSQAFPQDAHPRRSLCSSIMQSWPKPQQVQVLSQGTTSTPNPEPCPAAGADLGALGTSSDAQLLSGVFNPRKGVHVPPSLQHLCHSRSWWAKAPPQPVPGLLGAGPSTSSCYLTAGTRRHIPCAGGWAQNACSGEQQLLPSSLSTGE